MPCLTRFLIAVSILIMTSVPTAAQFTSLLDSEVRVVAEDRLILPGGRELPVQIQDDGGYGPLLGNYPMLLRVGYIELARLHIVQGVVVQVEVIQISP